MLKDTLVTIPKNTREKPQNGNVYIYHVIESVYDPAKRYNTDKRICIGKKYNDTKMYPNDNYFKYYDSPEEYLVEAPEFSDCIKVGAMMTFDRELSNLGISNLLSFIIPENSDIFKDLIYYYTFGFNTATQYYKYFIREYYSYCNKIYSDSQISRIINTLTDDNISSFLSGWNNLKEEKGEILIDFDGTNMNSSISESSLAEYGKPKDDEGLPQINLSYAIDHNTGMPLFYELYPGSITDMSQTKIMIDKAKNYGYSDKNITFILDRGMFSKNNLDYLEENGFKYIIMAKTSLDIIHNSIIANMNKIKNQYKYFISSHNLYGITLERDVFKDKKLKYLHIYYDDEKASIERKILASNLAYYEECLKIILENKKTKKSELKPYKKYFLFEEDRDGYINKYDVNNQIIQGEMDLCGFFAIVTKDKLDTSYVIDEYRKRDIIEKTFRDIKSYMNMNKFKVHSDTKIKVKTFIAFISSIIKASINTKLKKYLKENSSDTLITVFKELSKIEVTKINDVYVRKYALTGKQKKILTELNLSEDTLKSYINLLNMSH